MKKHIFFAYLFLLTTAIYASEETKSCTRSAEDILCFLEEREGGYIADETVLESLELTAPELNSLDTYLCGRDKQLHFHSQQSITKWKERFKQAFEICSNRKHKAKFLPKPEQEIAPTNRLDEFLRYVEFQSTGMTSPPVTNLSVDQHQQLLTLIKRQQRRKYLQIIADNLTTIQKFGGDKRSSWDMPIEENYNPKVVSRTLPARKIKATQNSVPSPKPPHIDPLNSSRNQFKKPTPIEGCRCVSPTHEAFMRAFNQHKCACFIPLQPHVVEQRHNTTLEPVQLSRQTARRIPHRPEGTPDTNPGCPMPRISRQRPKPHNIVRVPRVQDLIQRSFGDDDEWVEVEKPESSDQCDLDAILYPEYHADLQALPASAYAQFAPLHRRPNFTAFATRKVANGSAPTLTQDDELAAAIALSMQGVEHK